jgi:hypothetical protein
MRWQWWRREDEPPRLERIADGDTIPVPGHPTYGGMPHPHHPRVNLRPVAPYTDPLRNAAAVWRAVR